MSTFISDIVTVSQIVAGHFFFFLCLCTSDSCGRGQYVFQAVCLSHSRKGDISRTPLSNFLKFGTNVRLDAMINLSELGGQRSL